METETAIPTKLPELRLSRRREWAGGQSISFLMKQGVENPDVVSLAAGLVDPSSLPVEESRIAVEKLLSDEQRARQVLQYGTTQGAEPLRRLLLEHLAKLEETTVEGLGVEVDRLILTTGSQQLLSLVGEVLLDPGDICLVAAPTYFVFLGLLNGLGARAIPVKTDEDGMCADALESKLEQLDGAGELARVKLIYLVSYYENPSGVSLSAERREAIVRIAKRWSKPHRLLILEDAAYRELRYDGPALPSVWGSDPAHEHVILSQTFSKTFSPGLRVGYGVLPSDLVQPICDRKGNEDFGSANFNQHLIATVIEQGLYARHVEDVCRSYRRKRDAMLAAAERYFADIPGVHWVHPHGGLYVWMTLPASVETGFDSPLFRQATQVEKMMYVPGEICHAGPSDLRPKNQMRLSFGVQDVAGIDLGMQRLANAIRAVI
ncbi:MAG: PLP-dependent aminotransferase family protein [Planctomycetes bacterium]|nr:PLP-dependent aminotransferase family protein [Planctomycetota bacterium]